MDIIIWCIITFIYGCAITAIISFLEKKYNKKYWETIDTFDSTAALLKDIWKNHTIELLKMKIKIKNIEKVINNTEKEKGNA